MFPSHDGRVTRIVLVVFFIAVLAYAYYEARGILYGPRITVSSGIQEVREPFVVITGRAERISELLMNGKTVNVTEEGAFEEPHVLTPGLNRIILDARDKYGRRRQEVLQIVYTPDPSAIPSNASTTLPSASTTPATSTEPTAPETRL